MLDHQVVEAADRCLERKKSAISNFSKHPIRSYLVSVVVVAAAAFVVVVAAVGAVTLVHIFGTILTVSWNCSSCPDLHHRKSCDAA